MKNPNCDNDLCASSTGEVRTLPVGGGGNAILCRHCYSREMEFRRERISEGVDFDLPLWESLKVYAPGTDDPSPTTGLVRAKKYKCKECGHETTQSTNHYGETYSLGRVNICPNCPPYKRPNTWECLEPVPPEMKQPEPWKKVKI